MNENDALTPDEVRALREMLDRDAIQRCIGLYFHALDSRDFTLLEQVYDVDASASFTTVEGGNGTLHGRADIVAAMRNVAAFRVSLHGVRNTLISIEGDTATADTFAVDALLIDERGTGDRPEWQVPAPLLRFHGLRYVDELVRGAQGWRITSRRHKELWRYHATGVIVPDDKPSVAVAASGG